MITMTTAQVTLVVLCIKGDGMTREELKTKIVNAILDKRPEDSEQANDVAEFILSRPYINEDTYEAFMESAGLL